MGERSLCLFCTSVGCPGGKHSTRRPSAIQHSDCGAGQANKQASSVGGSPGRVCVSLVPYLNLICLSPHSFSQTLLWRCTTIRATHCLKEERFFVLIFLNNEHVGVWLQAYLTGSNDLQRKENSVVYEIIPLYLFHTHPRVSFFFPFPLISSIPFKWIEVKWEFVFSGWFKDTLTLFGFEMHIACA